MGLSLILPECNLCVCVVGGGRGGEGGRRGGGGGEEGRRWGERGEGERERTLTACTASTYKCRHQSYSNNRTDRNTPPSMENCGALSLVSRMLIVMLAVFSLKGGAWSVARMRREYDVVVS